MPRILAKLWAKTRVYVILTGLLATLFLLFFWNEMVVTVHSGELGVKYSRFSGGTELQKPYPEGVYFILPFDILYLYDMRIIEHAETFVTLTQTGLPITVSVSCQYQLDPARLPLFHQQVGPSYPQKIILPMMNTVVRQVFGAYDFDSLYSSARQELEDVMMVKAISSIGRLPITIHNFVIKSVSLPREVEGSIIEKMIAQQQYRKYKYLLLAAEEEAKRKDIEARGIKNFQELVNTGMTENYLRYEGILATRALAGSNNAKIVVTGGKDGLPLILNTDMAPAAPQKMSEQGKIFSLPQRKTGMEQTPLSALPEPAPARETTRSNSLVEAIDTALTQGRIPSQLQPPARLQTPAQAQPPTRPGGN